MKTLVVLAALAAVALAAPAKPERSYERFKKLQNKYLSSIRRDKKSPQSLNEDSTLSLDIIPELTPSIQTELDSAPAPSARTFKKPIIIKKKHGYHLYRDSEEERAQADPQEKCTQELKFKVCNPDLSSKSSGSDILKSSTVEDASEIMTDSEIESSIQMAKEAVEHLQKMSQWKSTGPDTEMHEDIEVAKMALEHIQKNLGHLESMSLRATTLSEAEALEDGKVDKTEEEKMIKWKEAMETIQKNVEIARSIEDSFKSQSEESHPVPVEESHKIQTSSRFAEEKPSEHELVSGKSANAKPFEFTDEMTVSATEPKESIIELHDIQAKSNPEATLNVRSKFIEKKIEGENTEKGKNSESDLPSHVKATETENMHFQIENIKQLKAAEHDDASKDSHVPETHLEKSAWKGEEMNILAKSTENVPAINDITKIKSMNGKTVDTDRVTQLKSDEPLAPRNERLHKETLDSAINTENRNAHIGKSMKSAESTAFTNEFDLNTNQDNMMMKSADQLTHETHNVPTHMEHNNIVPLHHESTLNMKAAEHFPMQQLHEPSHLQTQAQAIHPSHKTPMKAAEQIDEFLPQVPLDDMELARHSFVEPTHHHHMPPPMHSGHYGHMSHNHQHHHLQHQHYPMSHGHIMHHGKEADMDSAVETTMQVTMKDATGKSALEHNEWNQEHSTRGAYGASGYGAGSGAINSGASGAGGAGAGSGAVGVFPHARVGNCGIPLLLSCSPSVQSGSLAKSHSYGPAAPPAYRAGEDFNHHNKRDTKKTNEIPAAKVKRNPRKITKKTPTYA